MDNSISLPQLLQTLKTISSDAPKFTLFLGAGASVSSGVKTGKQLVQEWRAIYDANATHKKDHAKNQEWHGQPSEYGHLFGSVYSLPAHRRDFVETCIEEAVPSWGYLYLADLLDSGFFNTVLTTNFDDLLNEACHAFTAELRPLICSHDASIKRFRFTSKRPKIIKLHGDFLFDDIKNTQNEVQYLEKNTEEKLSWLAEEFGVIFVGYGGNDESVMSTIEALLRDENKFPNGIYWCRRSSSTESDRLRRISKDRRFKYVEIDDFDSLMADIHGAVTDSPPKIIVDPYAAIGKRLSHLLSGLEVTKELAENTPGAIRRDLKLLAKSVPWKDQAAPVLEFPIGFVGDLHYINKEYPEAIRCYVKAAEIGNMSVGSRLYFFECLRYNWDSEAFDKMVEAVEREIPASQHTANWLLNASLSLIHAGRFSEATKTCRLAQGAIEAHPETHEFVKHANALNQLQLVLHRGDQLNDEERERVKSILDTTDQVAVRFGCLILLGEYASAVALVRDNQKQFPAGLSDWPIIKLMPTSELNALRKLVGGDAKHFGQVRVEYRLEVASTGGTAGRDVDSSKEMGKSEGKISAK
jgi:NAD-dependent SIR2 family protein deacetylase